MGIVERVYNYILTHQMVEPGDAVVVAVSGGADSVSLLHILNVLKEKLKISLHVAHLDHMFRGRESQKDAEFVKLLCEKWRIPCTTEAINVTLYQEHNRLSSETAAREVRYRFLNKVAENCNAKRIALGHHADDQAETVLLNLLRGTGTTGMAGIAPLRDNKYIRPLLEIRRYEIELFCKQRGLNYRIDGTNNTTLYLRNRLRLSLIPLLQKEYNREIVTALGKLAELSREENNFIVQQARQIYPSLISYPRKNILEISVAELYNQHVALQRRIIRMIWAELTGGQRDLAYQHVESVLNQAKKLKPSQIELPGGVVCKIAYGKLSFAPAREAITVPHFYYPLEIPGDTYITELGIVINAQTYSIDEGVVNPRELPGNEAVLDCQKTGNELYVRNRNPGDKFSPQGIGGIVKLKKFLIDQKVPQEKRNLIPLICGNKQIIWVSGLRIGEYWKVTEKTKEILHLKIKNIVS